MIVPQNIALVVNPLHAKAKAVSGRLALVLQQKQVEHTVFVEQWPDDWTDFTEAWIVGGDGTLNYFINHYPQFSLPMALFKGGTGNDFHWLLYGNVTVEGQAEIVLNAKPKSVDAGFCNRRLFLNGIGIGFDGKVVKDLGQKKKNRLAYYAAVLRNIFFFKEFLCAVGNQTFNWGKKCLMISVANGRRYGGGFHVNPDGVVHDGLLDVYIIGHVAPLLRFRYLPLIEKGAHTNLPFVTYLKTGGVHIRAAGPVPAHADGEGFSASEFVIECLPAKFLFLY